MQILQTTEAVLDHLLVKKKQKTKNTSDSKIVDFTQRRLPLSMLDTYIYTGISATHVQKTWMQSVGLFSG